MSMCSSQLSDFHKNFRKYVLDLFLDFFLSFFLLQSLYSGVRACIIIVLLSSVRNSFIQRGEKSIRFICQNYISSPVVSCKGFEESSLEVWVKFFAFNEWLLTICPDTAESHQRELRITPGRIYAGWVIIHSGILVDYKNKMAEDTTMKLMLFERAYSKVVLCI